MFSHVHSCVCACMRICTFLQYPSTSIKVGIAGFTPPTYNIEKLIHPSRVHECKLTGGGHLAAILVIRQSQYPYFGENLIKVIYIYTLN